MSTDNIIKALFRVKHKGSMDLRANLNSVKKEDIKQKKVNIHKQTHNYPNFSKKLPDLDGVLCVFRN